MRFAWQGFEFDHPSDWAPSALTGNRDEGYARIANATKYSVQIRWKKSGESPDLWARLTPYLDKIERDSKRSQVPFTRESEAVEGGIAYRYQGKDQGRGWLFYSEACGRVFFLEATAGRKDSLLPAYRNLQKTFRSPGEQDLEPWAVLGLDLQLPYGMEVEGRKFFSGRTQLQLRNKKLRITAERWGFGEQLAARHGLASWAKAVAQMPSAEVEEETEERVSLVTKSFLKHEHLIALLQPEQNQIQWVKVTSRGGEKASWEWLMPSENS